MMKVIAPIKVILFIVLYPLRNACPQLTGSAKANINPTRPAFMAPAIVKPTLAAPQKIGEEGSPDTFAALVMKGWFRKYRLSLHLVRTQQMRT
jgi:hypothetical protein